MGIEPTLPAWKAGALPLSYTRVIKWWRGQDSNLRRRTSADLQSAAFDRSATPPQVPGSGAVIRDRTQSVNELCPTAAIPRRCFVMIFRSEFALLR